MEVASVMNNSADSSDSEEVISISPYPQEQELGDHKSINNYPRMQCIKCNSYIQSSYSGEWVACQCGSNYIDSTEYYTRMGGLDMVEVNPYGQPYDDIQ
jgi:hypothetical protein